MESFVVETSESEKWLKQSLEDYCRARAARMKPRKAQKDSDAREEVSVDTAELELHEVDEDMDNIQVAVENLNLNTPEWAQDSLNILQEAGLPELCKVRGLEKIFCEAAISGRVEAMKILLGTFPLIIHPGCLQSSALRDSAGNGQLEPVRFLLELDVDANQSGALRFAAKSGCFDICKELLESRPGTFDDHNLGGALRLASENGSVECVKLLLKHGADPSEFRSRACQKAAMNRHVDVVHVLIQDPRSDLPLYRAHDFIIEACKIGHVQLLQAFLRKPDLFLVGLNLLELEYQEPCLHELLRCRPIQRYVSDTVRRQVLVGRPISSAAKKWMEVYKVSLVDPAVQLFEAMKSCYTALSVRLAPDIVARIIAMAYSCDLVVSYEAYPDFNSRYDSAIQLVLSTFHYHNST
mmetsp:Transcript_18185/g.35717  ORF Transcript_18185/g.35717 Transcript_18185/m.35717 type:complete len:410 (-) Transcript_18185:27-1256(-)